MIINFADIERAAAPKCNHAIAIIFAICARAIDHVNFDRVRMHLRKERPPLPFSAERPERFVEQIERFSRQQTGIGDDQRLAHSESRQS